MLVNGRRETIPSRRLVRGDVISVRPQSRRIASARSSRAPALQSPWLDVDRERLVAKMTGYPDESFLPFELVAAPHHRALLASAVGRESFAMAQNAHSADFHSGGSMLAESDNVSVFHCSCGNMHLQIGAVCLTMHPDELSENRDRRAARAGTPSAHRSTALAAVN